MGTDNLHHKRKARTINSLKRQKSLRDSYEVVLIVCEGEKTEPNYLIELRDELGLNSANIKVLGTGIDPLSMVNSALENFESDDFDRVYCVFDKDKHSCYHDALNKINSLREKKKNSVPIFAITSVPCFEYWLLLHFVESTKPYNNSGSKSAGDILKNEMKKYITNYHEGHDSVFQITKKYLSTAIARAKRIRDQQESNKTDNPSTNFFELIEYLQGVKG